LKQTTSTENKTLVLEAFDTLFNKRDFAGAECYWSPNYIQHSVRSNPGSGCIPKTLTSSRPNPSPISPRKRVGR
jgi:predicted SnoaL-like aldol condensation-catalyzing enzyme